MLLKSAAPWARHCSLGLLKGHTGGISAALPGDAGGASQSHSGPVDARLPHTSGAQAWC